MDKSKRWFISTKTKQNFYSIENSIETINYNLVVSKTPEDLAQYGLDNPLVSALITLDDGSKTQLNIGIKLPVADGYYAMINEDSAVYIINNGCSMCLTKANQIC